MKNHPMLAGIWQCLDADLGLLERLTIEGDADPLPGRFDVLQLAISSVAAATLAVASLAAERSGSSVPAVHLPTADAAAAFSSEMLFEPIGWQLPPVWDEIAGNYPTQDGWIRLHTNYERHREAVYRVLGSARTRGEVATAVSSWRALELETAVVAAGGCAAQLHTIEQWQGGEPGRASAGEPPITLTTSSSTVSSRIPDIPAGGLPLAGIRVLDLTRVIAGPECTRLLAAYGAQVLRLDPPGFAEVPALLPEMLIGKRSAWLDLATPDGRAIFCDLVSQAHVLVVGLRPDALAQLGLSTAELRAINPALIIGSLNAYGWSGPWKDRRGFDSLVQLSTGLAADSDAPIALPVQALDHAAGFTLAVGICRALEVLLAQHRASEVKTSLVAMANLLLNGDRSEAATAAPDHSDARFDDVQTGWGPARRVAVPGRIEGVSPRWSVHAGPLGRHAPAF